MAGKSLYSLKNIYCQLTALPDLTEKTTRSSLHIAKPLLNHIVSGLKTEKQFNNHTFGITALNKMCLQMCYVTG